MSYYISTRYTPFNGPNGRNPPLLIKFVPGSTGLSSKDNQPEECVRWLKAQLLRAQRWMKLKEDISRRDVDFQVGEHVYMKLQPYKQQSLAKRSCAKLLTRYYWPLLVVQRVGTVTYKLPLPATSRIYPVFHVSQLKKEVETIPTVPVLPPNISETIVWEEILGESASC